MKNDKIADIFTLSPIQQGMLFHILTDTDSAMYYEQEVCRVCGEINLNAFRTAWERLTERHQMLRTFFAWENLPHPVQIVQTNIELPFAYIDLRDFDETRQQEKVTAYLQNDVKNAAKIDELPLFRLQLFQLNDDEFDFIFSIHHLIHDAWSFAILLEEFIEIYEAVNENRQPRLDVGKDYKEFVVWLKTQKIEENQLFWQTALEDFDEKTPLPVRNNDGNLHRAKNLSIETSDVFGKAELFISPEITAKLSEKARREKITPNIIFQSLWAILTAHLTKREKIVFGVTVAGRPTALAKVETIVGNFINTLPLAVSIIPNEKISELWRKLQNHQAQASQHASPPLSRIAAACGRKAGEEMFESIFVYQNFAREFQKKRAANLCFESFRTFGHPNYPLTLRVTPGNRFFVEFLFDERVCDAESVCEMAETFIEIVDFVAENENLSVADVMSRANDFLRKKRKTETLGKRTLFAQKLSSVKTFSASSEKN